TAAFASANNLVPQPRPVFGVPLVDAVENSQPLGVDVYLPAVVYRCLEYLKANSALDEEGIFRLSGSNITIKALRERFNTEGDVKLLEGEYYDVHAVASLLKLYLRELPTSILTRELHLDFLKVLDLDEKEKKVSAFNVLVHKLPRANLELIQSLTAFLIDIVNNSDVNKMNVRNVGIVFAPTLNIPAPLISTFLTDYPRVFGPPAVAVAFANEPSSPIHEVVVSAPTPTSATDLRSPRHQMFSDLPTPAYNQTGFQQSVSMGGFAPVQAQRGGGAGQYAYAGENRNGLGLAVAAASPHPYPGRGANGGYDAVNGGGYQTSQQQQTQQQMVRADNDGSYGSMDGALAPPGSARDAKRNRRESSVMQFGVGGTPPPPPPPSMVMSSGRGNKTPSLQSFGGSGGGMREEYDGSGWGEGGRI
ncbi:hypothetical protein LTS18_002889, partial [Coniosporium uncinatum]